MTQDGCEALTGRDVRGWVDGLGKDGFVGAWLVVRELDGLFVGVSDGVYY